MPADVRINDVTTDVNVTDASALLTPQVMERIVQTVLRRLEEERRTEQEMAQERSLGGARQQGSE